MEVSDLAGVGELLNSDVANKAYDHALSGPAQQTGALATDALKAFRLFLAPLQLAAAYQDRLEKWLDRIRNEVPLERQIEAEPSIAGPVMRQMEFLTDENPLTALYLTLLRKAIDRETASEAHPAFPTIIGQLSADEAFLLFLMKDGRILEITSDGYKVMSNGTRYSQLETPLLRISLTHLQSLNLVSYTPNIPFQFPDKSGSYSEAELTPFGRLFALACIPDELPTNEKAEAQSC